MTTLGFLNVGDKKYSLKYGESYVIGFMSNDYAHDIEINDKSVDIRHCIMDFTEPIPRIFDIKSKCGTFVENERIPSCCMFPLKKSTNIQIGDVDTIFQFDAEVDSGYLEERVTPPVTNNVLEKKVSTQRVTKKIKSAESRATNPSIAVSKSDHFLVPTGTTASVRSRSSSTTNESFDSFSIPETQVITKYGATQAQDNEESYYIPETQDVVSANAILCNYPRVAFENEDVNETGGDCDKIPSSQFRICTQDFNGSDDEQCSNHSDDILANVPCSLVIPTIRHSPVQINDTSQKEGVGHEEIERELLGLQWSKTSPQPQSTHDASTPDGICTPDYFVPQAQIEVPNQCSQRSTPDIFADQEPLLNEMDKSLKENDPPSIVIGYIKQSQVLIKPPVKSNSSMPNFKENKDKSPLPPTQVFVPPPLKTKHPPMIENKEPKDIIDDLPPTQVFQPVPTKSKTSPNNICLSSTLVDSGMQLSESSFKAKCNKLLDSDDDEMDEVVAPELVHKYRQSLKKVKDNNESPSNTMTDSSATSAKDNKNASQDKGKMLPPKNIPIHTAKSNTVTRADKLKDYDGGYVNIEVFLCTPDFLGKEFTKDEDLQKKAEQNWTKQRKSLFKDEATPTKPLKNESDDSQDSFTELLPHKKKQEENQDHKEVRSSPQRKPSLTKNTSENKMLHFKSISDSKVDDVKKVTKQIRVKRSTVRPKEKIETVGDKNETSPKANKSKDSSMESISKRKKHSDEVIVVGKMMKDIAKRQTRLNSNSSSDDKMSRHLPQSSSDRGDKEKFGNLDVSFGSSRSSMSCDDNLPITHRWTEKRILEVVLNKNGARRTRASAMKSSSTIGSSSLSGTRRRTRSSDASVPSKVSFNTSFEERIIRQKSPQKAFSDEKKHIPNEKGKSKVKNDPEEEKVAMVEIKRARKQTVLNKIVEEEGDKPQKRVTRLASAKQGEAAPITDKPKEPKQLKTSRVNRGRTENPKGKQKHGTAEVKELEHENPPNSRTASSAVKRKNSEDEVETKRSRSASSESIKLTTVKTKPKLRIAMTMCDPRYQEILEKHSGSLWVYTKDPKECDVLILEKGNRTYKLMVAIARGIPVVKLDWLIEVLKKRSTNVPTEEYIFQDRQFQDRHQFVMKKSLFLANASPLFRGVTFMMTPNIRPTPSEMEDIVKSAGGTVLEQAPKLKQQRMYLISQSKDNQYWHQYRRSNSNLKIVTTEGVMASVMQQSEAPLIKSIIQ